MYSDALCRSRECPEPVVAACLSGSLVCAALPSQYVLLDMEGGGGLQQLFTIQDPAAAISMTRIGRKKIERGGVLQSIVDPDPHGSGSF